MRALEEIKKAIEKSIKEGLLDFAAEECDVESEVHGFITKIIDAVSPTLEILQRENKDLKRRLFPYADTTEISGISWDGKYLIGGKALEAALSTDAEPVIIAYACSSRPNVLWSAAQYNSALPKNRTECDIPLVALSALSAAEPSVAVKLEKLPAAFEVLDTENGTYLTRSEQAAIDSEYEYNGLYRRDGSALTAQVQDVAGWQPIETAPEDGTDVLLSSPHWHGDVVVGCWSFEGWRDRDDSDKLEPTHWMPLPAAPITGD